MPKVSRNSEVSNSRHIILDVHIIIFDPIKLCYPKMPEDYAMQYNVSHRGFIQLRLRTRSRLQYY